MSLILINFFNFINDLQFLSTALQKSNAQRTFGGFFLFILWLNKNYAQNSNLILQLIVRRVVIF